MPKIWCYIQEIQTVKILSQNEFLFCSEFSEYVSPICQEINSEKRQALSSFVRCI